MQPHFEEVERLLLEKVKYRISVRFPSHRMGLKLDHYVEECSYNMIQMLEIYLSATNRVEENVVKVIEIPTTMWNWIKHKYAPAWFVKRWPVVYTKIDKRVTVTQTYICPYIEPPDNEYKYIAFLNQINTSMKG